MVRRQWYERELECIGESLLVARPKWIKRERNNIILSPIYVIKLQSASHLGRKGVMKGWVSALYVLHVVLDGYNVWQILWVVFCLNNLSVLGEVACKDGHFFITEWIMMSCFFLLVFFLCCPVTQLTNTRRHAIPEKISLWLPFLNLVEKQRCQAVLCSLQVMPGAHERIFKS